MALKNSANDLSGAELAALRAADVAGHTAALAGTAAIHADESAAIGTLFRALRGRGVSRPINYLLGRYFAASQGAQMYDHSVALACAATPGTIDDSRSVEGT